MTTLHERTVLVLTILFCIGVGTMLWHVSRLQSNLIETMALANAQLYTQALTEFRTLYTREVVERVRPQHIEVTHDYASKEGAIPLPATLTMELGESIGRHRAGAKSRLYSPYPFPWRQEQGGLQDEFGRKAWEFLTQNPGKPFYGFEEVDGRLSLRYATADLMRASCVNCHNTHLDSPKTDWKEGDVRGVLEIIHPMDAVVTETRAGIGETFGLMAMLALIWLGGLGLVITSRKRAGVEKAKLEERLRQSQKLEAVGQLAGGIAHDFNNLLTVINGHSQLLLDSSGEDEVLRHGLEQIQYAGERAGSLTRQLLAFSRKQVLSPKVLDLNGVVAHMEKLLGRLIGEHITLITDQDPTLGSVKADPGQIEQILLNLAVNARDAMPRGGQLTIETKNVELDKAYAGTHAPTVPGPYVLLAVSDTGCGMDAETQAHMFEPFFTTKEPGKGTGLGLAMVYGIVIQSGGYIWVDSEPGKGSTFKIYLPRVWEVAEAVPADHARPEALRGSETVLVVEDEEVVRILVRAMLETYGYTVLVAQDGTEALRLSQEHAGPIHLLLSDSVMPGMSGRETAQHLASLRLETKVLYMSGYTDKAVVQHGGLHAETAFLQKPFTPDALARKVREVLDANR